MTDSRYLWIRAGTAHRFTGIWLVVAKILRQRARGEPQPHL
jgi:hypothetical protein